MPIIIKGSGGNSAKLTSTTINGAHFSKMTYKAVDYDADGFEKFTIMPDVIVRKVTPSGGNLVLSDVGFNPRYAAFVMADGGVSTDTTDLSVEGKLFYLFYDRECQLTRYPITYIYTLNSSLFTVNLGNSGEHQPKCIYDESARTLTVGGSSWHDFIEGREYLCMLIY